MILTITLNPSMDYIYHTKTFKLGSHNRLENPTTMPGGKGINCSRTLALLGADILAFTILGGDHGSLIATGLEKEVFPYKHIIVEGESRNALTIMHDDGIQTEIVESGPLIDDSKKNEIFLSIVDILRTNTQIKIITINGSVNSNDENFYPDLLNHIKKEIDRDLVILMDQSNVALKKIFNMKENVPNFIKPNIIEFSGLVEKDLTTKEEVIATLKKIKVRIPYLLVSCGSDGAVAKINDKIYDVAIPTIHLVNPTGSGDATVGGVAYAFEKKFSDEDVLRHAMACGVANAMEAGVGVVSQDNVDKIFSEISITEVI